MSRHKNSTVYFLLFFLLPHLSLYSISKIESSETGGGPRIPLSQWPQPAWVNDNTRVINSSILEISWLEKGNSSLSSPET